MKRSYALVYPPEFDGELHVHVESAVNGPFEKRTITVVVSCDPNEAVTDTIRRVGKDMERQPLRRRSAL